MDIEIGDKSDCHVDVQEALDPLVGKLFRSTRYPMMSTGDRLMRDEIVQFVHYGSWKFAQDRDPHETVFWATFITGGRVASRGYGSLRMFSLEFVRIQV